MEYSPKSSNADAIKAEAYELSKKLLSRDPILYNSALNAYFDSQATYHGHGLNIRGISQIKHASWSWGILNLGRGSEVSAKDVHWNHQNLTLTLNTTRHLRPIFLPLFTFAVPVKSVIKFQPTRDEDNVDHLYAVHWDDQWPLARALEQLPVLGFFFSNLFSPIFTYFFLAISNLFFALNARVMSFSRHWTSPQAQQQYSQSVPVSVRQGFHQGEQIAQGWGRWLLNGAARATYHPLQVVEWSAQTTAAVAGSVLPFRLPQVSVFDPQVRTHARSAVHGAPLNEPIPLRTQKSLSAEESHAKRTAEEDKTNPRGDAQHAETAPYELLAVMPSTANKGTKQKDEIKKATVEVGPSTLDNGHTIDVLSHQFNDAGANPSHGSQPARPDTGNDGGASEKSLFDQVDQATLKKAEEAGKKAKAALNDTTNTETDDNPNKPKKAKHSPESSGRSSPEKTKSGSKKSSSGKGTPTKKRKEHGH